MNKSLSNNLRAASLQVLIESLPSKREGFLPNSLLVLFPQHFSKLESTSHSLAKNICYGVFRHYFFLNACINQYLDKPLRNKDADIQIILLAASYELIFLNTPEHAVISEWVELCKSQKKTLGKRFG